jgi:hypothetical protein
MFVDVNSADDIDTVTAVTIADRSVVDVIVPDGVEAAPGAVPVHAAPTRTVALVSENTATMGLLVLVDQRTPTAAENVTEVNPEMVHPSRT